MIGGTIFTVEQIASRIGGVVEGDGQRCIAGVAPLAQASPDDLAWLAEARYVPEFENTAAGAVLVREDSQLPTGRTVIRVADPELALCLVLAMFAPAPPRVEPGVHRAAFVDTSADVDGACIAAGVFVGPHARIGARTQLHPGVYVGEHSRIGEECVLWPNVAVRERVTIGDRVVIHANATIGTDGFGYVLRDGRHHKIPQIGTVMIEDDVEIGANAAIDRARSGQTRIGRGTKIDNLVQVAHNVQVGAHCILVAQCGIAGSTTLGDGVVLGGQVGVTDHVTIGAGAQVAAMAGVSKDIAPGAAVRGNPAREMRVYLREAAAARRLPDLIEQVRSLARRVEQLESAAHHRT